MKSVIILFLILISLFSCKKEDKYPDIQVFGHAGAGLDMNTSPYEENTLESITYALSYSEISGVEVDIQWSKDGTIWLFHDQNLETQTNGSGCVRENTDQQLSEVHFKGFNQEKLVKLNDVATKFTGRTIILDLKDYGCGTSLSNGDFESSLLSYQSQLANTEVIVIVQDYTKASFLQGLGWKVYLEVQSAENYINSGISNSTGCSIRNEKISQEEVANIQNLGKEVIIFDARSPKQIRRAFKKTPNGFIADDLKATLIEKIR